MAHESWFPARQRLHSGSALGELLFCGSNWQIHRLDNDDSILIALDVLADRWIEANLVPDSVLSSFKFGEARYKTIVSASGFRLEPVAENGSPVTKADGLAFALSLKETREIVPKIPLHDAIYVERYSRLLPTWTVSEGRNDEEILGRWLTGGVAIRATSARRLSSLVGWLERQDVADLVEAAGFHISRNSWLAERSRTSIEAVHQSGLAPVPSFKASSDEAPSPATANRQFHLQGRPRLEAFFNEHVIDIIKNADRYKAFGIDFPTGIVLHGPPGCGKTFAVERLVEYLDWPVFYVNSNSVGSPYIHETSKKVGEIFDRALDAAPSMIVIDEMESYLADRQINQSTALHHVEEVAEFLRRIPEANERHVLVIGMTNRIDMIDAAILRRGRFDHIVEVGMPSATEVVELVDALLAKVVVEGKIDTGEVVKSLTGRPLADAAYVIREAARLAAWAGKTALDDESMRRALTSLPPTESKTRAIGFIQD